MTKPVTWTTRDGTVWPVRNMTDAHLLNTIRYLRRTHQARCRTTAMSADAYSCTAPDGAADCAEAEAKGLYDLADDSCDAAVSLGEPRFATMLREAKRRGLTVPPGFDCTDATEYGLHPACEPYEEMAK